MGYMDANKEGQNMNRENIINKIISQMPEEQKECILMHYLSEESNEDLLTRLVAERRARRGKI